MNNAARMGGEVLDGEALASRLEEQREEAQQHQRRAEQRVEEELDGGVPAVVAAPHADHEVHGQQHDLEEHEEQNEVLGHERPVHSYFEDEDQREEGLGI